MGDACVQRLIEASARPRRCRRARHQPPADRFGRELDGATGIAADVSPRSWPSPTRTPDKAERTLVCVGRCGALFPFFRHVSALLSTSDGRTRNVPVVLLYPGERREEAGLSFMGELDPDRDYRPRIYRKRPRPMKLRDLFHSNITATSRRWSTSTSRPRQLAVEVDEYHHRRSGRSPAPLAGPRATSSSTSACSTASAASWMPGGLGDSEPASWISGFYGSGKSGASPNSGPRARGDQRLATSRWRTHGWRATRRRSRGGWKDAHARLRCQVELIAVVPTSAASPATTSTSTPRSGKLQERLGYCNDPRRRDGAEARARRPLGSLRASRGAALGRSYEPGQGNAMADDDFSTVMAALFPRSTQDPMAWLTSRAGTFSWYSASAEEAGKAIADMLRIAPSKRPCSCVIRRGLAVRDQGNGRTLKLQSFRVRPEAAP
ncbi:MAG: DUF1788 domain-containing protein [Myxococcales bacterium]|nr:DUF1788 domain-containing protein [Myxococcales bacterium]